MLMKQPLHRVPTLIGLMMAIAAAAGPASAQKQTLRWKHRPGSELVYRVANHQEMEMAAMAGSSVSEQIQTQRWRVEEVAANGDATITITTERVQLDMQGIAGNVKYDSDTDEAPANPQARILAAMKGVRFTAVIGADGTLRSVRGLAELREKVMAALPPEQAGMVQAMSGEMFSEESMGRMMQQSVQLFPAGPIGPGDTWRDSLSMPVPMLGTITTNLMFTLTGFEQREGRTVATIANTGDFVLGADASSALPVTFDLGASKMTGTIDFDVDRGITLASDVMTTMQMTVGAGGQQVTMAMKQSTRLELIEYVAGR